VLPESGEAIANVCDSDEAFVLARDCTSAVWTLAEVALAIAAFGDAVCAAKRTFPGSRDRGGRTDWGACHHQIRF